ncbi:MAG TPA: hypothetical protein VJY65_06835 [Chloroflexota bacterium]|nr:hypothetical protein [Chloroflexota bacterium]
MRLVLNLEELHVETTVMQPEDPAVLAGFDGPGAMLLSQLWDTQTRPIIVNTNSSPCIA